MEKELTEEQKKEVQMFGVTQESMEKAKPDVYGNLMYAMSILSDAQEMIALGNGETARQFINKAKLFITKEMTSEWECNDCGEVVKYSNENLLSMITCPKCGFNGNVDN